MLILLLIICLIAALFGLAFRLTGAVLAACLWILKLPFVMLMWILGLACCCTIILIPVGLGCFRLSLGLL